MRFKYTDAYHRAPAAVGTDNFTVVAIIRPELVQQAPGYAWLLSHGVTVATQGYSVGFHIDGAGQLDGIASVAHNAGVSQSTRKIIPNKWAVVGWQRTGGVWNTWLDGIIDNTNIGTYSPGGVTNRTLVNRTFENTNVGMNGDIFYVGQWSRVLTPREMLYLGQYGNPMDVRDPVFLYDFSQTGRGVERTGVYPFTAMDGAPQLGSDEPRRSVLFYSAIETDPGQTADRQDAATVYIDIQVSSAQEFAAADSATVPIRIKPSATFQYTDATTVYVNISFLGGECYSTFSGLMMDGEADTRWYGLEQAAWFVSDVNTRWETGDIQVEGVNC